MITIGIPVFNEGKYLEETILSVIGKADKIIISDNCSTDETQEICKKYTTKYKEIIYIRQEKTIDVIKNFQACLNLADTEYFMFLGGHDLIPGNYIKLLVNKLEKNHQAVLAYAPIKYIEKSSNDFIEEYDYYFHQDLECRDPFIRVYSLIKKLGDGALFHGVFRTSALKKGYEEPEVDLSIIGTLHVVLCEVAKVGHFLYEPKTYFIRRKIREEEDAIRTTIRYTNYLFENVTIETIYFDYYRDMKKGQLDVVKKIKKDDITIKNFWINESSDILESRFSTPITVDEYIKRWEYLSGIKINLFSNLNRTKNVAIFGTLNIAKLLAFECEKANINVISFIDNNISGYINNISINNSDWLECNLDKVDLILLSLEGSHDIEIINNLRRKYPNKLILSWKNLILYSAFKEIYHIK